LRRVIIYKANLLPPTQTFVREQALHLRDWTPIFVGRDRVEDGLDLSRFEVVMLENKRSPLSRLAGLWKIIRRGSARSYDLREEEFNKLIRLDADLVHVHFGTQASDAWGVASRLKLPLLVTLHGYDINNYKEWWESGKGGSRNRNYPSRLLALAEEKDVSFLAVSEAIRQRAVEFGIPPDKVEVSYIGVDSERFTPGPEPLHRRTKILFVGRLVEKKGCIYLVQAFNRIQEDFPRAELIVVGSGPLEADLRQHALETDTRVTFTGALSSEAVREYLGESRVVCVPSIVAENGDAEGLPIIVMEAQACGVPVITSARGADLEGIVDGETGFAHDEGDVDRISDCLRRLLTDERLLSVMGAAARRRILDDFDIQDCTRVLERHYSRIAAQLPKLPTG
jgi:glycosyltransferase involved in cell wall biosynthesis